MTDGVQKDPKIALEQYRNVLGYLQYENTIYWTRSGFMLIAHSTLFGFLTRLLPPLTRDASWLSIGLSFVISVFGLILSILWMRAIKGALWWIERWHQLLVDIEPDAYGDRMVFRGAVAAGDEASPHHSTRKVAEHVVHLFRVAWIVAAIYTIAAGALQVCEGMPSWGMAG